MRIVLHMDGADTAHAAQIVAAQVHQHHVLGSLLGIIDKFLLKREVLLACLAPGPRTGDRTCGSHAFFQLDELFRRRTDQRLAAQLEEEIVGRRIDHAQGPVQRKGGDVGLGRELLRGHDLNDFARLDCRFALEDHVGELVLRHFAGELANVTLLLFAATLHVPGDGVCRQ